jgi:hypothetical protein
MAAKIKNTTMTLQDIKDTYHNISDTLSKYPILFNTIKILMQFIITILIVALTHWSLVYIYSTYCFQTGWVGALKNIFTLGSPFCQFVNYSQFELSKHYITIWTSAAVAIIVWSLAKLK